MTADPSSHSVDGQSFVEFVTVLWPISLLILYISNVFVKEWHRVECAYQTFEQTHRHIMGKHLQTKHHQKNAVRIYEQEDRWVGIGHCDGITERVELPKLETAEWD